MFSLFCFVFFFFLSRPNTVLTAAAFTRLWFLCLAINKRLWIAGEAGSQYSCLHVQAGRRNDWSSGGLKNAVWRDCRIGGRARKERWGEALGEGGEVLGGTPEENSQSGWFKKERGVLMIKRRTGLTQKLLWIVRWCDEVYSTLPGLTCELIPPAG